MTRVHATALVAGRELRESFRRRTLWIILAIIFVGSTAAMILPGTLSHDTTSYDIGVVSGSGPPGTQEFESAMHAMVPQLEANITFRSIASASTARTLVDDSNVDVAVITGHAPEVIVRSGEDTSLVALVRSALASNALKANLASAGLDANQIATALATPAPTLTEVAVDDASRRVSAAILSLVLYLLLLMLMIQATNGVAIEKANRISEVLLAVVRPGALLFGKVIGVGIVGLASLAAGAIPVLVKLLVSGDLPAGLGPAVAAGITWMVLGLVLYLTIAGALGALIERQEEAGSALAPLSLLLVATYVIAQSVAGSAAGAVLAIFPLTAPIVMPARIALGKASVPEVITSLVIGVATVVLVVRVGAVIYRRGIVHTGSRLHLREAFRRRDAPTASRA